MRASDSQRKRCTSSMRGLVIWVGLLLGFSPYLTQLIYSDPDIWSDPQVFRPERWYEQPDAPLFSYGIGYRMCAGSLLANRELYLVFLRMLNSFSIEKVDDVNCDPVTCVADPTSLVASPHRYRVKFVPRSLKALRKVMEA